MRFKLIWGEVWWNISSLFTGKISREALWQEHSLSYLDVCTSVLHSKSFTHPDRDRVTLSLNWTITFDCFHIRNDLFRRDWSNSEKEFDAEQSSESIKKHSDVIEISHRNFEIPQFRLIDITNNCRTNFIVEELSDCDFWFVTNDQRVNVGCLLEQMGHQGCFRFIKLRREVQTQRKLRHSGEIDDGRKRVQRTPFG